MFLGFEKYAALQNEFLNAISFNSELGFVASVEAAYPSLRSFPNIIGCTVCTFSTIAI